MKRAFFAFVVTKRIEDQDGKSRYMLPGEVPEEGDTVVESYELRGPAESNFDARVLVESEDWSQGLIHIIGPVPIQTLTMVEAKEHTEAVKSNPTHWAIFRGNKGDLAFIKGDATESDIDEFTYTWMGNVDGPSKEDALAEAVDNWGVAEATDRNSTYFAVLVTEIGN